MAVALVLTGAVVILQLPGPGRPPHDRSSAPSGMATPAGTPGPTATVSCQEEPADLALGLSRPACPSAIAAVELAVTPLGLPVDQVVIEPGPFYCDVLWPGVQTAAPRCGLTSVQPGQFMHAWVAFRESPKVAVVMLGLDLPDMGATPRPTPPPWNTTLVTVEIPPTGWVMP